MLITIQEHLLYQSLELSSSDITEFPTILNEMSEEAFDEYIFEDDYFKMDQEVPKFNAKKAIKAIDIASKGTKERDKFDAYHRLGNIKLIGAQKKAISVGKKIGIGALVLAAGYGLFRLVKYFLQLKKEREALEKSDSEKFKAQIEKLREKEKIALAKIKETKDKAHEVYHKLPEDKQKVLIKKGQKV